MSDCGVCLSSCSDFETTMYKCNIVKKAGRDFSCYECGKPIPKGTSYELASGLTEGDFWTAHTCLLCAEIAQAFSCDGRLHGSLWHDMSEIIGALTIGCLNRLKTPEAKAMLQQMWIEEKGLA